MKNKTIFIATFTYHNGEGLLKIFKTKKEANRWLNKKYKEMSSDSDHYEFDDWSDYSFFNAKVFKRAVNK
jgi:ferric-dicitrate binding protein FerR (iron transport regulator)